MNIQTKAERILQETEKIIVGKHKEIELILTAILAEGHILLDDVPGVGKTITSKMLVLYYAASEYRVRFSTNVSDLAADSVVEITTEILTDNIYSIFGMGGQSVSQGAGSGVILSEDGYILTVNYTEWDYAAQFMTEDTM